MVGALRIAARNKYRQKWGVIKKTVIEDLLVSSGFSATTIVDHTMVEQVAKALQADGYMYGWLSRKGRTPELTYRMVDVRRTGMAGWMKVIGQPEDPPRTFARRVMDSLRTQVKAADLARDCSARRDRGDFKRARDRAYKAFELYPNHPAAAMCLSYVFEATRQGPDSIIWAYEKAAKGDSLYLLAWENLARQYQRRGDTARAVNAFAKQLRAHPDDQDIRYTVAAGYIATKNYARGRQIIEEGLRRDPDNLKFVGLKARGCFEGAMWDCALEALTQQYELDSSLVGDTSFYQQVFAIARQVRDTAAMLRWASEGLQYAPNSLPFWRARATLLQRAGVQDSALMAFERLIELDPADALTLLTVTTIHARELKIDSATPLDTAALTELEGLLERLGGLSKDTTVIMRVAGMYYTTGQKLVQLQIDIPLGVSWLEKAQSYDWQNKVTAPANFWIGFGLFVVARAMDTEILDSESCSQIGEYQQVLNRGFQAMTAGRSVAPKNADQLLSVYRQLRARPAQFRQAYKCK
ncbi:MAG: tetratricopeptide repeat protein [Gemmatimonadales bacterium]